MCLAASPTAGPPRRDLISSAGHVTDIALCNLTIQIGQPPRQQHQRTRVAVEVNLLGHSARHPLELPEAVVDDRNRRYVLTDGRCGRWGALAQLGAKIRVTANPEALQLFPPPATAGVRFVQRPDGMVVEQCYT